MSDLKFRYDTECYYCFDDLLAVALHRPALKTGVKGLGTPYKPNCRGFTPDEIGRLDFSKVDFSDFANEVKERAMNNIPHIDLNKYADIEKRVHGTLKRVGDKTIKDQVKARGGMITVIIILA